MNRSRPLVIIVFAVCATAGSQIDSDRTHPMRSPRVFGEWKVTVTHPKTKDDIPLASATICLTSAAERQCYTPPIHSLSKLYFGLDPKWSAVRLSPEIDALFFTSIAFGGGSGHLKHLSLLQPGKGKQWTNLFPNDLAVTEQGEYHFWTEPSVSPMPLFVMADYIWGRGETHFDRHRFRVSTYCFDPARAVYRLCDEYATSRKYPSLNEADTIRVLSHERSNVVMRVKKQGNNGTTKGRIAREERQSVQFCQSISS